MTCSRSPNSETRQRSVVCLQQVGRALRLIDDELEQMAASAGS